MMIRGYKACLWYLLGAIWAWPVVMAFKCGPLLYFPRLVRLRLCTNMYTVGRIGKSNGKIVTEDMLRMIHCNLCSCSRSVHRRIVLVKTKWHLTAFIFFPILTMTIAKLWNCCGWKKLVKCGIEGFKTNEMVTSSVKILKTYIHFWSSQYSEMLYHNCMLVFNFEIYYIIYTSQGVIWWNLNL